jgi:hypothetical protein
MTQEQNEGDWRSHAGGRRMRSSDRRTARPSVEGEAAKSQCGPRETAGPCPRDSAVAENTCPAGQRRVTGFSRRWIWGRTRDRKNPLKLSAGGPIDWTQMARGLFLFGLLSAVLWLEWVAIKAIAIWVADLF